MSQDEGTTVNTEQPVTPAPVEPSPANPAPVTPAPVEPSPANPAPVTPAPVETPETPTPQPVDPAAQPEKPLEPVEQPKVTVNVEVPTESGKQQNSVNQAAGTPAATVPTPTWVDSVTTNLADATTAADARIAANDAAGRLPG